MAAVCIPKKAGKTEFLCYFQLATMIISGKWKPRVLYELSQSEVSRFGELRKSVFGITEKMLIQSLKELEKDGMVKRKVYRQVPPKVEYSLTDVGRSFIPILNEMFEWGKSYASYLLVKGKKVECDYTPGMILENIDDLVAIEEESTVTA